MKTINNKKVSYVTKEWGDTGIVDKVNDTDYFEMIKDCCNKPGDPKSGFTYSDIKSIDKVVKALSKAKANKVEVEDADLEFIKTKIDPHPWRVADIQFVEFVDYIKGIK